MIGEEKSTPAAECTSVVTHIVPGWLYILLLGSTAYQAVFTVYCGNVHSKSLKVIDVRDSQRLTYDFLLVINSNYDPVWYHFTDMVV